MNCQNPALLLLDLAKNIIQMNLTEVEPEEGGHEEPHLEIQ